MERKNKGFTLVEIIVVLLIIAIPAYQGYLEESRESRDLINVRAACTDIIVMGKTGYKTDIVREVELTQKKDDWQTFDSVTIAGITHKKSDGDTDNWKGSKTEESTIDFSSGLHSALNNSGLLDNDLKNKTFFEIDSKCDGSTMVPKLKEQIENKSLLNHGTWAYYGNPKKVSEIYLFWTSVDTDKVGANKQIPVIISTADGKFYISSSTAARKQKK